MIRLTKPRHLQKGDRIAAITLSWGGPAQSPQRYQIGKAQFQQEFGVEIVETRHALRDPAWLAKNPKARAEDLMEAFSDPNIHEIISTIGGDDSVRLLPHLNLETIRRHPKVFMGYSDTTITHLACFKAGLGTFYGPSFMSGFAENGGMFPYMASAVCRTLFSTEPLRVIEPSQGGWTVEHLEWRDPANQSRRRALSPSAGWKFLQGEKTVSGHLLGGCADVLEDLKGTDYWPTPDQWNGAILFLETSENAPSPLAVLQWLRNYAAQGILHRITGLLVGRPGGHQTPQSDFQRYDAAISQVINEELGLTTLPIVTRMDFGHTDPMMVLPYGLQTTIDCKNHTLTINEAAVH